MRLPGVLALCGLAAAEVANTPVQYVYSAETATTSVSPSGCKLSSWEGMDADGVAGYPWVTTIECPETGSFTDHGVAAGALRFYLWHGRMAFNRSPLNITSSSVWAGEGSTVLLEVSPASAIYIVGARYDLSGRPSLVTSSFESPRHRVYDVRDALRGNRSDARTGTDVSHEIVESRHANAAAIKHDPHIDNGTTNAMDVVWSSQSGVDPPAISVLNCAMNASYVWYHFHPAGAMYIPYSGKICFQTDVNTCITPGFARWTSANLYYYETFQRTPDVQAPYAQELVTTAGMQGCVSPVTFSVTNFDPDDTSGQPNFVDVPANGVAGKKWGIFQTMTVRLTTVISRTVRASAGWDDIQHVEVTAPGSGGTGRWNPAASLRSPDTWAGFAGGVVAVVVAQCACWACARSRHGSRRAGAAPGKAMQEGGPLVASMAGQRIYST